VEPTIVILGTQYSDNPKFYKHIKYCLKPHTYLVTAHAGSGVVRIDPLHFLDVIKGD